MTNTINSKRFVIRKSLIGKNTTINVEFKNGKSCTYNHDKVYEIMKDTLTKLQTRSPTKRNKLDWTD